MKKTFLALMCTATLAFTMACGGNKGNDAETTTEGEATTEATEKSYDDMTGMERFEAVIQRDYGFKFADVKPDSFSEEKSEFSGHPEPGHMAKAKFVKADGTYTDAEAEAYIRKLYDLTKGISQDGKNVLGFGYTNEDPKHALDEADIAEVLKMVESKWCFRINDNFFVCKVYNFKGKFMEVTFVDGITKPLDEALKDAEKVLK